MDASVAVKSAETAEMDDKHSSGRPLGARLLVTEAGVSADVALGLSRPISDGRTRTLLGRSFEQKAEVLLWFKQRTLTLGRAASACSPAKGRTVF
jgi:hypothetical protein